MVDYELAKKAYDAYGDTTNHLNYQGLPMPKWEDLTPTIQMAWNNAALKVSMETNPSVESPLPTQLPQKQWRNLLDVRQIKTLADSEEYARDAFGDVAHNLKCLVAKMAHILDDYSQHT